MSLTSLFISNQRNGLSDDQGRWRQFILDHLDYIAVRSNRYTITPELMNLFRYDLKRFLREHTEISRKEDIAWIVQLLNDIPNDFHFFESKTYTIPSDKLIQDLYHSHITITKNQF